MSEFKIGDRVVQDFTHYNDEEENIVGEIIGLNSKNGKLIVQPDWSYQNRTEEWDPANVISEADAKIKISTLEKEFKILSKQVSKKVAKAAALLAEANSIANDGGYNLRQLGLSHRTITDELHEGGWSGSSMSC